MRIGDLLDLFRAQPKQKHSASAAKQRLQLVLAVERPLTRGQGMDFMPLMQREILDVIRKYIPIDDKKIKVEVEREQDMSLLAVSIELPNPPLKQAG